MTRVENHQMLIIIMAVCVYQQIRGVWGEGGGGGGQGDISAAKICCKIYLHYQKASSLQKQRAQLLGEFSFPKQRCSLRFHWKITRFRSSMREPQWHAARFDVIRDAIVFYTKWAVFGEERKSRSILDYWLRGEIANPQFTQLEVAAHGDKKNHLHESNKSIIRSIKYGNMGSCMGIQWVPWGTKLLALHFDRLDDLKIYQTRDVCNNRSVLNGWNDISGFLPQWLVILILVQKFVNSNKALITKRPSVPYWRNSPLTILLAIGKRVTKF